MQEKFSFWFPRKGRMSQIYPLHVSQLIKLYFRMAGATIIKTLRSIIENIFFVCELLLSQENFNLCFLTHSLAWWTINNPPFMSWFQTDADFESSSVKASFFLGIKRNERAFTIVIKASGSHFFFLFLSHTSEPKNRAFFHSFLLSFTHLGYFLSSEWEVCLKVKCSDVCYCD